MAIKKRFLFGFIYRFVRNIYRVLPIPGVLRKYIEGVISPVPTVIPLSQSVMPDFQWYGASEPTGAELEEQRAFVFPVNPLISLVMPITEELHESMIELFQSLKVQTYKKFEFHIINKSGKRCYGLRKLCRSDKRFKYHLFRRKKIRGEYIGFMKQNYTLAAFALYEVVRLINESPDTEMIYSDEDRIDESHRYEPQLKPGFSPDTLLSTNYIESFFFVKRKLLDDVDKTVYFNDTNYFELALRMCDHAKIISHIPKILAHMRYNRDYSTQDINLISKRNSKLIQERVERQWGLRSTVTYIEENGTYYVMPEVSGTPKVSILIPNKDGIDILRNCVETIIKLTTYTNYEINIIENNSENEETFAFYRELETQPQVNILYYPHSGFNYHKIINFGVKNSEADFIVQLNNDTELLTPDWLELMIGYARRSDVGAVGVKLLYPNMSIQHVGGVLIPEDWICTHMLTKLPRYAAGHMNRAKIIQNLCWVSGACMMSRKEIYEQVGFLDEDFEVNLGDVDFCMKIRALGKLIILNPFVELIHLEGKTRGFHETSEKLEMYLNELELFRKKWAKELEKGDPYYNPWIVRLCEEG
jgi:GT2 family glycosyltransferase